MEWTQTRHWMGVKLMYAFALPNIQKQLCTKICFSSLSVSECSSREFLQSTTNNALLEFLFVMLDQKLDFSLFESFIYNKNWCFCLFYKFNSHNGLFPWQQ